VKAIVHQFPDETVRDEERHSTPWFVSRSLVNLSALLQKGANAFRHFNPIVAAVKYPPSADYIYDDVTFQVRPDFPGLLRTVVVRKQEITAHQTSGEAGIVPEKLE
jgi:hypothetical protein